MRHESLNTLQRAMERTRELDRLKRGYVREFGEIFGPLLFYIEQFGVDCRQLWVANLCKELSVAENQPENQALLQKVVHRSLKVLRKNEFASLNQRPSELVTLDQE